jgi:stress response protein YsnF
VLIGARPFWFKNITEEFAMPTSVIGLFESQDIANKAVAEVTKGGVSQDAVDILASSGTEEISSRLVEAGYDEAKAQQYAKALQQGGALVIAEVEDDRADAVLEALRKFEVLTPEALLERTRSQGKRSEQQTEKAQVIEEELEVGKSTTTGGKRLKTEVSEREVEETVSLREENVDVERSRVDRTIKPEEADKAFQERTVEMTETKEKPVVSKQARVVEEVALSKQSGQREQTVSGTVRRQDVKVEDVDRKATGSKKS